MPKPRTRKTAPETPHAPRVTKRAQSAEYREYLERYAHAGQDRPKLTSIQFDELDDELLDLLSREDELADEQVVRLRELEYLLIESEA